MKFQLLPTISEYNPLKKALVVWPPLPLHHLLLYHNHPKSPAGFQTHFTSAHASGVPFYWFSFLTDSCHLRLNQACVTSLTPTSLPILLTRTACCLITSYNQSLLCLFASQWGPQKWGHAWPNKRDSKIKAKMKARKEKIRDLGYKWTQSWAWRPWGNTLGQRGHHQAVLAPPRTYAAGRPQNVAYTLFWGHPLLGPLRDYPGGGFGSVMEGKLSR